MKKILILSASYGEGHNAAARGLLAALTQLGIAEGELYDPEGRLLAKANLVAGGADLQVSGLADLPKVIRDSKKSRSC